jgi:hypothetical protein
MSVDRRAGEKPRPAEPAAGPGHTSDEALMRGLTTGEMMAGTEPEAKTVAPPAGKTDKSS